MTKSDSAEAAYQHVNDASIPEATFSLMVSGGTFAGQPDTAGAGMPLVVDVLLKKGFWFTRRDSRSIEQSSCRTAERSTDRRTTRTRQIAKGAAVSVSIAALLTMLPLSGVSAAPSAKKLVLTGSVTAMFQVDADTPSLRHWGVTLRVERVKAGKYSEPEFTFTIHSPARAGLAVGEHCTIKATWTGHEYLVHEPGGVKIERKVAPMAAQGAGRINATDGCRSNAALAGPCFEVQGRAFVSNGTPSLRIAIKSTKRVLGVLPPENEIAPKCLRAEVTFKQDVVGHFTVCPFNQDRAGAMRMVCVEEVRDAAVRLIGPIGAHAREHRIEDCQLQQSSE